MRSPTPASFLAFAVLTGLTTLLFAALPAPVSQAQDDEVDWGFEGGDGGEAAAPGEDPLVGTDTRRGVDPFRDLPQPGRLLGRLGVGVGVRLGSDDSFDQDVLAPPFVEALGGYVFSGSGLWRHGVTLEASVGLLSDGPAVAEVQPFGQYAFNLSYLAYFRLGMDLVFHARIGPTIALSGTNTQEVQGAFLVEETQFEWTWGGEVHGGVQYNLLAGFGVYGDLGVAIYAGAGETVHPIVAVSAGAVIDYELIQ